MTETPHEDDRTVEAPVVPLATVPGLQTLDVGLDGAIGMVCDIDDPDCVPGALSTETSMAGDRDA